MKQPRIIYSPATMSAYQYHIFCTLSDVRARIRDLAKSRSTKDGTIGAVMALRVLLSGGLGAAASCVSKGEVEFWKAEHTNWVKRVEKKLPSGVTAADVLATAEPEFTALMTLGVDTPSFLWQSDALKDLRRHDQQIQRDES